MTRKLFSSILAGAAVLGFSTVLSAATQYQLGNNNTTVTPPSNIQLRVLPDTTPPSHSSNAVTRSTTTVAPSLKTFTRSIVSTKDGNTYSYTMVGNDPFLRGKLPTTTNVKVIPMILTFTYDGSVFDATKPTSCSFGHAIDEAMLNSPIFQPNPAPFISNGVNVGATQYEDAEQRAEFWSLIQGADYHTLLSASELPAVSITVGTSVGFTDALGCTGILGLAEVNAWDNFLQSTVIPTLQANGLVDATEFPFFLVNNVVFFDNTPSNCCILGYHSAVTVPGQTYGTADFDTTELFSGTADTSVAAHEVGEWINDPYVNNATPAWGGIGQVTGCQANLEVGDPLSGTLLPPVSMPNGFTYHLQELGFFSWYFNSQSTPSLGAGGEFSFNGTFTGPSMVCPPGGTF